jgi:hypothetical protein
MEAEEKFTIELTDHGMEIYNAEGIRLRFDAGEALMLLDILKQEEVRLREMADNDSPMPLSFHFQPGNREGLK